MLEDHLMKKTNQHSSKAGNKKEKYLIRRKSHENIEGLKLRQLDSIKNNL